MTTLPLVALLLASDQGCTMASGPCTSPPYTQLWACQHYASGEGIPVATVVEIGSTVTLAAGIYSGPCEVSMANVTIVIHGTVYESGPLTIGPDEWYWIEQPITLTDADGHGEALVETELNAEHMCNGAHCLSAAVTNRFYAGIHCTADFTGDGIVDLEDWLFVIDNWNDPYTKSDLMAVLAEWGYLCIED